MPWKLVLKTLSLGLFAIILQSVALTFVGQRLAVFIPHFLVLIVVFLGLFKHSILSLILVFSVGILCDLTTASQTIGPSAFALTFVFLVLMFLAEHLFLNSFYQLFIITIACSLAYDLIYSFLVIYIATFNLENIIVMLVRAVLLTLPLYLLRGLFTTHALK
jgi:cell shape-determining protein MreD